MKSEPARGWPWPRHRLGHEDPILVVVSGRPNDEASRYKKDHLERLEPNDCLRVLRSWLQPNSTVLDVGCGSGETGRYLAADGHVVHGLEANEDRAALAREKLPLVEVGVAGDDFEPSCLLTAYDHVVLVDVLEHVVDALDLLSWCTRRLKERGSILCVVPNSAHAVFRIRILRGNWSYEDAGMFDRDHVRFYDIRSISAATEGSDLTEVRRHYSAAFPRWWIFPRWASFRRMPNLLADRMLVEWQLLPGVGSHDVPA